MLSVIGSGGQLKPPKNIKGWYNNMIIIAKGFLFQYNESIKKDIIVYVYKMNEEQNDAALVHALNNDSIETLIYNKILDKDFEDQMCIYEKSQILSMMEGY